MNFSSFFLLLCDLFAVYIKYFLFVMVFSPHNLLVFIFLSALFLFNCFFVDFLINLPKYIKGIVNSYLIVRKNCLEFTILEQ